MGQQVSIEDALAAFREQYGRTADENVLLRAQIASLERQLAEATGATEQHPPVIGGPDLAGPLPYRDGEQP